MPALYGVKTYSFGRYSAGDLLEAAGAAHLVSGGQLQPSATTPIAARGGIRTGGYGIAAADWTIVDDGSDDNSGIWDILSTTD